jgi:hypothetical protein
MGLRVTGFGEGCDGVYGILMGFSGSKNRAEDACMEALMEGLHVAPAIHGDARFPRLRGTRRPMLLISSTASIVIIDLNYPA